MRPRSGTARSARRTCGAPASASEKSATASSPSRRQVRTMRHAISPRFATSTGATPAGAPAPARAPAPAAASARARARPAMAARPPAPPPAASWPRAPPPARRPDRPPPVPVPPPARIQPAGAPGIEASDGRAPPES